MTGARARERVCPRCGARYDEKAVYCQVDGARLEEDDDRHLGTVFDGRYRVEARLGHGGMGVVYEALDLERGRGVALKVLHPQLSVQPDAKRRFRREARLAIELRHPNLVRVLDFGATDEGTPYLVMELLHGETLARRLRPGIPLAVDEALALLRPICRAVEAAHARGVVHRDLKPENVFLARDERGEEIVKVLDFGIARVLDDDETFATRTGLIFGTARYISPEGARGEPTDARSDVYSLAVLTYQLLSGRLPFESNQPMALLVAHAKETPPDLLSHDTASGVPRALARAVMRALDKRPSRRPATAGDFLASLEAAIEPPPKRRPTSRKAFVIAAFALGFSVVATTGFAFRMRARDEARDVVSVLLERAQLAEDEGRIDGPDGVLALTDQILAREPAQLEARRLRERALDRKRAEEEAAKPPKGRVLILTESPRVGREVKLEVVLDRPAGARRVALELSEGGERRELPLALDAAGTTGRASFRAETRGEHAARLVVEDAPPSEPLRFVVEAAPARRAAPPPSTVTTIVAPGATSSTPASVQSGGIDWSPP